MPTPGDKHDDVEYVVETTVDGKPLTMNITTSPLEEVAGRHIQRIVDDHNTRNGEGSMKLVSIKKVQIETKAPAANTDAHKMLQRAGTVKRSEVVASGAGSASTGDKERP